MSGRTMRVTVHGPDAGQAVGLVGDPETIDAVTALCAPWLAVTRDGAATPDYTIVTGVAHSTLTDHQCVENAPDDEPPRRLFVSYAVRELVVDAATFEWRVMQVLRALRHLLRWLCYGSATLFLHAGMVSFGNSGVAYIGSKKAGKTSSVIAALLNGAEFVVNDDLTIRPDGETLTGYGWPRTVAVRRDTVQTLRDRLPGFPATSRELGHPSNRWAVDVLREHTEDGLAPLLWVYPSELAQATGARLRASAPLRALVLPVFAESTEPVLEPLVPDEAAGLLAPHVETRAVNYDAFLGSWFPHTEPGGAAVIDRLLATVPAFRLRQHMTSLTVAAELVRELAASQGDPACPV